MKKIVLLVLIIAAAALIILPGGAAKQIRLTDNNPNQSPLQIDSSGSQSQAGGVDLQSAMASGAPVNPAPTSQTVQSGSASSTPAQPSDTPATSPNYPPCYYCSPANHHVCPDRASFYPCYCGSTLYTNDAIACMAQ